MCTQRIVVDYVMVIVLTMGKMNNWNMPSS